MLLFYQSIDWFGLQCEAVELSLPEVPALLSSPRFYVAAPLGGLISAQGVTGFFSEFSRWMDGLFV